jgi:phosphate transport system substrate-binding protein
MIGQQGDSQVAGYVGQESAVGTIGYVEYSYTILSGYPAAKVLNSGGYYTEPTPGHVAVALLAAQINESNPSDLATYLTQDLSNVYTNKDPRTYPLSSYSYMILPTDTAYKFDAIKGRTLGDFGQYVLCQGQTQVDALGYSALPINLVKAGYKQLARIPGAVIPTTTDAQIASCNNPTFSPDGTNLLAKTDPFPPACDKKGPTQCTTGTGGAKGQTSANSGAGAAGAGASPSASGSSAPTVGCDPVSGICDQGDFGPGQNAVAVPTAVSTRFGNILQIVLMVIGGLILVALTIVPPVLARASAVRRERLDQEDA